MLYKRESFKTPSSKNFIKLKFYRKEFEQDEIEENEDFRPLTKLLESDVSEKLSLSILGLGYVGVVSAACFCRLGHQVTGVDPDRNKSKQINQGVSPIVEHGLGEMLSQAHNYHKLQATQDAHKAVLETDVTLVSVGTPSNEDGGCNLEYLKQAARDIALALKEKDSYHLVIFRSTVPPKTTRRIMIPILEKYSAKKCGDDFGVCFNPEFLRESTAIDDFYHPPKTVIGAYDERSAQIASELYETIPGKHITTSLEAAEFVKYIDNTWHALKVSFANEVGRLCKAMSIDSHDVMRIFMEDKKLNISANYLLPGGAFGGSCLPKDTRGISQLAQSLNVDLPVISHINSSNTSHIEHVLNLIETSRAKCIGLVGITFKPETDDCRESPALILMESIIRSGYRVRFFDPCILEDKVFVKNELLNVRFNRARCNKPKELLDSCDTLVISHNQNYAKAIVRLAGETKQIIDLVRLDDALIGHNKYTGVCW